MPSISVTIPIPTPTFFESTTITTIALPTLNVCTTSITTPITKPYDTDSHPSDSDFYTLASFSLTMSKARAFPENTSKPPIPPYQPVDVPIFDTFMERLRNNEPSATNSSDLTINISYENEIQS